MTKLPISVFIIARNEADRLPPVIRSVRDWVDEVHVIDSGSDDDTIKVSEALGAKTHFRAWTGYGPQKVYGESLCRNDWLLNIDADEEISARLRDEILAAFAAGPKHAAYTVPILPLYNFQERAHPWTVHHHPVRLYRKSCGGFKDSTVHDTVVMHRGSTGRLRGMVNHRSFRSLSHHLDKVNFYSSAQAEDLFARGREPSFLALLLITPLSFFKSLILRREILNGIDGVVVSYMYAFQRFIRLAKTRERFRLARHKNETDKLSERTK
jgi:glycosyltransferase involved in cell wall biosynthesis